MRTETITAIVLAAGQGTRMKSALPKVLHPIAGRPVIHYVVQAALDAGAAEVIVVVGHGRDQVIAYLTREFGDRVRTVEQKEQRGTGHAAQMALPAISANAERALVLYGDTPLVQTSDLVHLLTEATAHPEAPLALITCTAGEPFGYGRIIRDSANHIVTVREERDCSTEEQTVREINPGIYAINTSYLKKALPQLKTNNAQGEYYLTDIVAMAACDGGVVSVTADTQTLLGINDRAQLFEAEEAVFQRLADRWRKAGVTVRSGVCIEAGVELAPDVTLEQGVILRGTTRIGKGTRIDVGCVLMDAIVEEGVYLKPYSIVTSSHVGSHAQIGPFSHLRPGSDIQEEAHIGNFVETKNTVVRKAAKANHLAYLGDGDVGPGANIGAGTIFCNYDGFHKHRTTIGAGAFIGSDSQLIAPITIGEGAYVATGTTVTSDVPAEALAIGRVRQETKLSYAPVLRSKLQSRKSR